MGYFTQIGTSPLPLKCSKSSPFAWRLESLDWDWGHNRALPSNLKDYSVQIRLIKHGSYENRKTRIRKKKYSNIFLDVFFRYIFFCFKQKYLIVSLNSKSVFIKCDFITYMYMNIYIHTHYNMYLSNMCGTSSMLQSP